MFSSRRYYFLKIAETLNMTRAAEQLHVSQPSLTQYLNRLEKELDIVLVDRKFTPLRLTEAGRIYYDYLVKSKSQDEDLFATLEHVRDTMVKPLHIGMPFQKTHEIIRDVLPDFIAKHPEINISIWEGTSSTVKNKVANGEIEIGFGHTLSDSDPLCQVQNLNPEKIVIICHKDNPMVKGIETSLDNQYHIDPQLLNNQLFFQMATEYFLYEVESAELRKHNVSPKRRIIMSNLQAIIGAVIDNPNSGFAFIPDYIFEESYPKSVMNSLAFLKLDEEDFDWFFSMFTKNDTPMSREAKLFWNCVMENCCKM